MTSSLTRAATALTCSLALALSLGACSSSTSNAGQSSAQSLATTSESGSSIPTVDRSGNANFPEVSGSFGEDPEISAGKGDAPTQVSVKTLTEGTGAALTTSDTVLVDYELALWDGKKIESSFESGAPITFSLKQVIPGWTYGLESQKVGDRVLIVVPPTWGYGDHDTQRIPGGSTLVFVVDILDSTSNVSIDENTLKQGEPTGFVPPTGIDVSGDAGVEPTLSLTEGATPPVQNSQTTLITGKGAEVESSDYILYRGVGGLFGTPGSVSSSWKDAPIVVPAASLELKDAHIGDRIVFVVGASAVQSGTNISPSVVIMDIIGVMKAK